MTNKINHSPSCADDYDPNSVDCHQAKQLILKQVVPIHGSEYLALRQGLGRVLAEDIYSPINVPAHTNSAMDGYAIRGDDLIEDSLKSYTLVGSAFAGQPWQGQVDKNQCVRIMTGAVMPKGTDTVVMQEHVEREADEVKIGSGHKIGQNVRQAGEDLLIGQCALQAGTMLNPSQLGLISSLGMGEVPMKRKLRVAFFSTGDELRSIGETLGEGEIYDSNRYTLYGMLKRLDVDIIDMGVIKDCRDAVRSAFNQASSISDVVISSGGVSVGEADYIKEILQELGEMNFWKVAMKPGRPLTFGQINSATFFGLPGNPVSVMVTFYQFVLPALRKMMGAKHIQPLTLKARCTTKLRKRPGRTEFQRGVMETDENGELMVTITGKQGSGILRSMSESNCFIILDKESSGIEANACVSVQPFAGLI